MNQIIPVSKEQIEKTVLDRKKISGMRDFVRHKFSDYFNAHGFIYHEPGGLIPEHDESVLFTGSTISTFKPYLRDETVPENGLYMVQSCLRTQNTKILKNDSKQPQWASYFSSIGALTTYEKLDDISELTWRFYTECLGIPEDRMSVRIASKDVDLRRHWEAANMQKYLEFDANDPVYYTHKFGMDDVLGRNCNLAIKDHNTGELRDIGNIIVIEKNKRPIGVEIAFGVETIVSRLLGFPNPIAASLMSDIVPVKNEHSLKLADAISASVVILNTSERPVATNRGRVLRQYLQSISDLRKKADIGVDEIKKFAEKFELREFGNISDIPAKIEEYVTSYESFQDTGMKPETVNKKMSAIFPLLDKVSTPRQSLSSQYKPV